MSIKELSLDEGEKVEWHRCQCTFHRGHDWGLAVTNKSACIYKQKFMRGIVWTKFPHETISGVDICKPGISVVFLTSSGVISLLIFILMFCVSLVAPFNTDKVFVLVLFFGILCYIYNSMRGSTKMVIHRIKKRTFRYVSCLGDYSDEMEYDRLMLIEFAKQLSQKGIKTTVSVNISEKFAAKIQQYKSNRKQTDNNK